MKRAVGGAKRIDVHLRLELLLEQIGLAADLAGGLVHAGLNALLVATCATRDTRIADCRTIDTTCATLALVVGCAHCARYLVLLEATKETLFG